MAVSRDDVKLLFKGSEIEEALQESDIDDFIDSATLVATEDLSGKGLSSDRVDLITRYMAAHMIVLAVENGGLRRSRVGQADESYVVPPSNALGWNASRFGQLAVNLDTSGTLAQQVINSSSKQAEFRVV